MPSLYATSNLTPQTHTHTAIIVLCVVCVFVICLFVLVICLCFCPRLITQLSVASLSQSSIQLYL